jgi:DNA-binding response OmpR family regulator
MRILIAEDEPLILKAIELRFTKEGYEVITSRNGRDAMLLIEEQEPDIIITDIMMPFCSGLEVLGKLKNGPHRAIPVIVLSFMRHEKIVEEAFELGADDFVTKPFSLSELSLRVKRLIKIKTAYLPFTNAVLNQKTG